MMYQYKKNNIKPTQIIIRVVLYLSMVFSVLFTSEQTFNLLLFQYSEFDYGVEILDDTFKMIRYILPLLMAGLYYLIYKVYVSMITKNVNINTRIFNIMIEKDSVRKFTDIIFIVVCILIGVLEYIFTLYPFYSTIIGKPIKVAIAFLTMYAIYYFLKKGLNKDFHPLIVNALFFPAILMVVLI